MKFQQHIPSRPLNNFIESITYVEGNNKGTGLPKVGISLVFNLQDSFKLFTDQTFNQHINYSKYWVAGLQLSPTFVESYGTSKMLIVQFRTIGAFAFFSEPLHYFANNYITLDDLFQKMANETWERLQETESLNEKFLIAENFLYQKLLHDKTPNNKLLNLVNSISQHDGNKSISTLCREHGITRKHLNHIFREYIGVSPKSYSSLFRFQRIINQLSKSKYGQLTNSAYDWNYYDQAHFNNNFKQLSGLRPTEYIRLAQKHQSMEFAPHFIPKQ